MPDDQQHRSSHGGPKKNGQDISSEPPLKNLPHARRVSGRAREREREGARERKTAPEVIGAERASESESDGDLYRERVRSSHQRVCVEGQRQCRVCALCHVYQRQRQEEDTKFNRRKSFSGFL